ncbi:hypothetical protein PAXRUDRAFT_317893 [Paxillus rubicundulus Ve08.2h10]|uniref:Uncharacterized protein n=1 Tax=Paxillus rubicundulus Ve08.2h10 TaxID=930991 RepID=A0A0D0DKA9_9AGAM|nr:hypothetical protein PAXRUDRAFT_317893 [Paxillus rubicundulus Ve08.2h10]
MYKMHQILCSGSFVQNFCTQLQTLPHIGSGTDIRVWSADPGGQSKAEERTAAAVARVRHSEP